MSEAHLYFAYGSNLSHAQMSQRCPASEPFSPGRLLGYRLVFAGTSDRWGGAVADIRPDENWYVQGGIYRMTDPDLEKLDGYEGHPDFYKREKVKLIVPSGEMIEAWVYRMVKKRKIGKPSLSYVETIIRGFFDFDLIPPPEVSAVEYVE
jgi:gamma-glutamylcyclotransferase (GGCT)/AIG2-like uncharacterized protein YtfP